MLRSWALRRIDRIAPSLTGAQDSVHSHSVAAGDTGLVGGSSTRLGSVLGSAARGWKLWWAALPYATGKKPRKKWLLNY